MSLSAVLAVGAARIGLPTPSKGTSATSAEPSIHMASHSRRDPRLPDLIPSAKLKKESLAEIMERTRKKMGIPSKWEKYGENAVSAAEKANPEKE